MKRNTAAKILMMLFIVMMLSAFVIDEAKAVEARGFIVYEHKGKLWMIRPDKSDEKIISERGATAPVLISPTGDAVIYPHKNNIYLLEVPDFKEKLLYSAKEGEELDLFSWRSGMEGFIFRKKDGDMHQYFMFNMKDNTVKTLRELYETPFLNEDGTYWAYTTLKPGDKSEESQIYAGKVNEEKGNLVFQGKRKDILGWSSEQPVVLYSKFDKIYAFDVVNRLRQIIRLPAGFSEVFVIAYNNSGLLYYHKNQEEKDKGLLLLDPNTGEQKALIETDKTAYLVTYNKDMSKLVFFAPSKMNDDLGHGELYLFESKTGEATKLTKDMGNRLLLNRNLSFQWSPDGKYFIYERLKMKHGNIKRADIWVAGEGKNDQLIKRGGNPVWGELKEEE